jgi:hypothetical protein
MDGHRPEVTSKPRDRQWPSGCMDIELKGGGWLEAESEEQQQ